MRKLHPDATHPDALDILRWPGLLEEPERDITELLAAATDLFEQALTQMQTMRESEGARMHAVILDRCDSIDEAVAAMRQRAPDVKQTIRQRLDDRIRSAPSSIRNGWSRKLRSSPRNPISTRNSTASTVT